MKKIGCLHVIVFTSFCCFPYPVSAQDNKLVAWDFKTERISKNKITLTITADVAPGWHIYTQHLGADGPQPTRITFDENDSYLPTGETAEEGEGTRFYNDIYEMYIVWYTGTVSFRQNFKLHEPVTIIRGRIEYMTCDDSVCVQGKKEFAVDVNLLKQNP